MHIRKTIMTFSLLCLPLAAVAGQAPNRNGDALVKMCQGAERVPALSVMCHSYLNGFLDASDYGARHGGKSEKFCLGENEREQLPASLVAWIKDHPDALKQEAGEALTRMLDDRFPCGKKR